MVAFLGQEEIIKGETIGLHEINFKLTVIDNLMAEVNTYKKCTKCQTLCLFHMQ